MADARLPKTIPCKYEEPWQGKCGKPTTNGWCTKHEKLKCVSCGQKAVRGCGSTSSLVCGMRLCGTCQHYEGKHVTREKYEELTKEDDRRDREGVESERMLRERGVQTGLPKYLKEILDKKIPGYTCSPCHFLELKHGLMGFFPAIVAGTKIVVITQDIELIFRVWKSLEPRDSMLNRSLFYVNEELGVAYPAHDMSDFGQKQSRPHKLFKAEEINELFEKNTEPFKWASGLWGDSMTKRQFEQVIEDAGRRYNVSLSV